MVKKRKLTAIYEVALKKRLIAIQILKTSLEDDRRVTKEMLDAHDTANFNV